MRITMAWIATRNNSAKGELASDAEAACVTETGSADTTFVPTLLYIRLTPCVLRPATPAFRIAARITSGLLRRGRGAGTPACRVDTRVDPLTRKSAERRDESRRCRHECPRHIWGCQVILARSLGSPPGKDIKERNILPLAWVLVVEG